MPELPPGAYRAPASATEAELREKKSRFLAFLFPVQTKAQADGEMEELAGRFPDANHHCWARRLGAGPEERASDAGEPAGTAGMPILQVLRGAELSDVLVVVVRYFGGVKLGKGGLARAYGEAARLAVEVAPVRSRVPTDRVVLQFPYDRLGAVKRLVNPPEVELLEEAYTDEVRLKIRVFRHRRIALEGALAELGIRPKKG